MGYGQNGIFCRKFHVFAISFLILLISSSSQFRLFSAEGRKLTQTADNSKTVNEDKIILRAQIGSRPPRCDRRCSSCGHCEAIQVPTNPQIRGGVTKNATAVAAVVSVVGYGRGEGSSNYKPMSWKCKCGNLIFNP